jgi:hypothetical protein
VKIFESENFILHSEITPLKHPPGHYSFELLTQWLGAKNPDERRRIVQVTLSGAQLDSLAAHIHKVRG